MVECSSRFISLTQISAIRAFFRKMKGITNGSLPSHITLLEKNKYIIDKKEVADKKSKPLITLPHQAVKSLAKHLNIPGTLIQKIIFFTLIL
jgi:hypothetical protein